MRLICLNATKLKSKYPKVLMRVKSTVCRLERWTWWTLRKEDKICRWYVYTIDCVSQTSVSSYYDPLTVCVRTAQGMVIPLFISRARIYYGVENIWINI